MSSSPDDRARAAERSNPEVWARRPKTTHRKAEPMRHVNLSVFSMAASFLLLGTQVRADAPPSRDDGAVSRPRFDAAASAESGMMLPGLVAPGSSNASQVTAAAWSGYDSARDSLVVLSFADATIWGPIAVRAGISYVPESAVPSVQPHVGARVQILEQRRAGIDLGVGVFYRMERFTEEEGLAQALVSGAVHFGRTGVFANVIYGQDVEGDDREGELVLAVLHSLSQSLRLGVESRTRFKLGSEDDKRVTQPVETFNVYFAPTVNYALGPVALFAEIGPTYVRADHGTAGVLMMGGLGGSL